MEFKNHHEKRTKRVGIAHGFRNAVQLAKDLREHILKGALGPTGQSCDEYWQGEIPGQQGTRKREKQFMHAQLKPLNVQ